MNLMEQAVQIVGKMIMTFIDEETKISMCNLAGLEFYALQSS